MAVSYAVEPDISQVSGTADPFLERLARQRLIWTLALGLTGLLTGILWALGISAFPLVLVAALAGGLGLAQFSNLRLGMLGALAVILGGYAILLHFTDLVPWGLAAIGGIALLAMVALGMASLLGAASPELPSRRSTILGAVLFGLALLTTVVYIPWQTSRGYGPVWAMHNDAVIQMIKARVQLNFDGFNTTTALNSSPLTSALVAVAAAAGRLGVANPDQYLKNDVLRLAELWALLVLATSALSAWISWRLATGLAPVIALGSTTSAATTIDTSDPIETAIEPELDPANIQPNGRRVLLPIIAALIGAALPFTWYFAGFAFAYGFLNSTLALVILLLTWAIWLELPFAPPILVAGLLSLATVATLATWAPLALIPAGLTILALWRALRANLREPTLSRWFGWVLAALPVPLYGLFVTLPDFNQQGEALAVDGGIARISVSHVWLVALFAALSIGFYIIVTRNWRLLGGITVVLATGWALVAFLVHLNTRVGLPAWGYYPVKAAWTLTSLLLIIGLAALFAAIVRLNIPAIGQRAGMALASVLTVLLMRQYMWQPVDAHNFFAPVEILRSTGFAEGPWRANILFDSYRADEMTILSLDDPNWMVQDQIVPGDGRADQFANFWLLQVHPGAGLPGGPEIDTRSFAYTLDPRAPEQICATVNTWSRPTAVLTSDPNMEQILRVFCPEAPLTVELVNPAWGRTQ